MVEVCVLVTSGTLESDAIVVLSSVNDDAVGKRRASATLLYVWYWEITRNE